jgi:hypothetical protein
VGEGRRSLRQSRLEGVSGSGDGDAIEKWLLDADLIVGRCTWQGIADERKRNKHLPQNHGGKESERFARNLIAGDSTGLP